MPYSSTNELPAHIRKLSKKKQRQFMHVWNSTHKRTGSESRAFAAANSVAKKELGMVTLVKGDKSVQVTMYSGADDPDLPSHVKALTLDLRSRWVNNYNWSLQECLDSAEAQDHADEYTSLSVADMVEMSKERGPRQPREPRQPRPSPGADDDSGEADDADDMEDEGDEDEPAENPRDSAGPTLKSWSGARVARTPAVRPTPWPGAAPVQPKPWHVRFREWLGRDNEQVGDGEAPARQAPAPTVQPLTVFKSADGRTRFLAVYSNQFKDLEKQIISEAAHKEYAEAAEAGKALYPDMHLWHAGPATRWGTVETVSYTGGFAVAGGVVDPGREHVALKVKELADKGEVALSFGFYGLLGPDDTYHLYRPFEISPLPTGAEANPITGIDLALATKENGMAFSDKKKDWLKTHFKMDDAGIVAAEAAFAGMGNAIKAAGIEFKEADEPAAPAPVQPAPPPAPAVQPATTTEVPNPLADLANAVKGLSEQVLAMQTEFKAYKEADGKTVNERAAEQVLARVAQAPAGGFSPTRSASNVVPGAKEAQDDWFSGVLGGVFDMEKMAAAGGATLAPAAPAQGVVQ